MSSLLIRSLRSAELPNLANSGHPGAPMGMAAMTHVLFTRHMRFDPKKPFWVCCNFKHFARVAALY